eukprot:4261238-Amphidinium_carterae.1
MLWLCLDAPQQAQQPKAYFGMATKCGNGHKLRKKPPAEIANQINVCYANLHQNLKHAPFTNIPLFPAPISSF